MQVRKEQSPQSLTSPNGDFCLKDISVWPIHHWAPDTCLYGMKYPLLLKHKTSSFPSSDVQNSSFQPLQTTVPLTQREARSSYPLLCTSIKSKDTYKLLPACFSSFPLVLPGGTWVREEATQGNQTLGSCRELPAFPAAPAAFCSPNHSQQTERWGHQSCFIRTPGSLIWAVACF